jgi:hypothetical protein
MRRSLRRGCGWGWGWSSDIDKENVFDFETRRSKARCSSEGRKDNNNPNHNTGVTMNEHERLNYIEGTEPEESQHAFATRPRQSKSTPSRPPEYGDGSKPSKTRSANRPNRPTGTGRKSSGKRVRCGMEGCQAFESPAHSGYCSYHESQHLGVGEKPETLRYRVCPMYCLDCTGFCSPPKPGDDEHQYCDVCEKQMTYDNEQKYKKRYWGEVRKEGLKRTPAQIKPAAAPAPKPTGLAQYLDDSDEDDFDIEPL